MRPTKALIATAYHEAGHAVAAYHFGVRVKSVTIQPTDDSLGAVIHARLDRRTAEMVEYGSITPGGREKVERMVVIVYAGGVAERQHKGRHNHRGAQLDYSTVINYIDKLSGSPEQTEAYLRWLYIRTVDLVTNVLWPEIEVVAQALLEYRTLSGDELRQILQASRTRGRPGLPLTAPAAPGGAYLSE